MCFLAVVGGKLEARSPTPSCLWIASIYCQRQTHTHIQRHTHVSAVHNSESNNCTLHWKTIYAFWELWKSSKVSNHPRSLSFPLHAELSLPPYPHYLQFLNYQVDFPCRVRGKESACNVGDLGSIPRSGRSPGEENDNPLQYSCLENPRDRGAWQSMGSQRVRHDWATFTQFQPSSSSCFLVPVFVFTDPHRIFFPNRISLSFVLC